MDLLSLLLGSMTSQRSVKSLEQKSGGSGKQINKLLILAIPILLRALTKNAQSRQGGTSLANALKDHTSSRSIEHQIENADAADGMNILKHILGNDTKDIISSLAGQSGMDSSQVASVLSNIAPALLSGLSASAKTTKKKGPQFDLSDGIDIGDVISLFGSAQGAGQAQGKYNGTSLITELLKYM